MEERWNYHFLHFEIFNFQTLKTPCSTSSVSNGELINTNIFPNPFLNELSISFAEEVDLTIYSLEGKLILEEKKVQNIHLKTSNWASGMYIIKAKGLTAYQNAITMKQ